MHACILAEHIVDRVRGPAGRTARRWDTDIQPDAKHFRRSANARGGDKTTGLLALALSRFAEHFVATSADPIRPADRDGIEGYGDDRAVLASSGRTTISRRFDVALGPVPQGALPVLAIHGDVRP